MRHEEEILRHEGGEGLEAASQRSHGCLAVPKVGVDGALRGRAHGMSL